MKSITQERILKALERNFIYVQSKPEIHIMRTFAAMGFRSMVGDANPVKDRDRHEN